ncbi:MAG: hypothetical protein NT135_00600 [Candidatus Berkelbacteria bacterium]|nr:hypothetical protein [Candidatus Berkelbacteria bacterium]
MERVVYLEPDEEITSVLDKLKNTEDKSVILVVPKGATLLQSLVNLKLLSKKAIELQKEIALVTADRTGRNLASLVGFSVYSNIKDKGKIKPAEPRLPAPPGVVIKTYAPTVDDRIDEPVRPDALPEVEQKPSIEPEVIEKEAPEPKKIEKPPIKLPPIKMPKIHFPPIPWGFWVSLIVSCILVFVILCFILPKTTVLLTLKSENYSQSLEIVVDQKATGVDFNTKIIPGYAKELEKEGTKRFTGTGKKNIGGKASGTVAITNNFKNPDGSGSEYPLKAGVEVKDKKTGKIFLTNSSVTVPALTYACDQKTGSCASSSGTANVKVTASEVGESYNIDPADFSIPGLGTSSVSARSTEKFTGGYDKVVSVVSQDDINRARNEQAKNLANEAKETLKDKLDKGQKLLEGAVKEEVLSSSSSVQPDTQASDFDMKVKIKISTLFVDEKEYKSVITQFLETTLPSDKRLISGSSDSVELSLINYDDKTQVMRVKATINTKITPKIDEDRLKEAIAKKTVDEATSYLKTLNEVENAQVKPWPFWLHRLPVADKIKLKISP